MPNRLHPPRPVLALLLALLTAGAVCWPTWPGFMSYDTLYAYQQSIDGVTRSMWPPMHVYLLWLSRQLSGGAAGLFLGQTVMLFFAAALIFTMWLRHWLAVCLGFAVFAALFGVFPTMIGTMFVVWKDVATASFATLGLALWCVAVRSAGFVWLFGAAAAFGIGVALRFNALPLLIFLLALMCVDPFGGGRRRFGRTLASLAVAASLAAAYASDVWRLPDLERLPDEGFGFANTELFDLIGISACAGRNLVPFDPSAAAAITPEVIQRHYDPRHEELAFAPVPGIPDLTGFDEPAITPRWREVVPSHLRCYLRHRLAVFRWQMGIGGASSFYPTHPQIDSNPYGFELARPRDAAAAADWIAAAAKPGWRRPFVLYLAASVLTGAALIRSVAGGRVMLAVLLGALSYPAALFIVGPAADARYIFPSSVFCALLLILAGSALAQPRVLSRSSAAATDAPPSSD